MVYVQASTPLREHPGASSVPAMPPLRSPDRDLATVFRTLRERDGRSQEALAHDAGLTVTSLARIERGQANPTWTTVLAIAAALDVSLVQLARAVERRRDG
jgi:DNA-binding XRE family transcriptional regulator